MQDGFYLDELSRSRASSRTSLRVTIALSDEDVPAEAHARIPPLLSSTGSCTKSRRSDMQGKYQNVRAYLAGPPPAVDAAIRMLLLQAKLHGG